MCKECGCDKNMVGKAPVKLDGKPTLGNNDYAGQGASPVKVSKGK